MSVEACTQFAERNDYAFVKRHNREGIPGGCFVKTGVNLDQGWTNGIHFNEDLHATSDVSNAWTDSNLFSVCENKEYVGTPPTPPPTPLIGGKCMHSTRAGDITTVAECSALAGRMGLKYWAGAEKDQAGQPGGCFRYEGTSSFAQYNGLYFNTNLAGVETVAPGSRYSVCNDAQYEAPAPTPAPPAGVKCPDSQGVGDVTTAAECIALAGRMGIKFHTTKNKNDTPGGCYQYHTTGKYAQYNGLYFNLNLAGRSSWANPGKYSVCSGA